MNHLCTCKECLAVIAEVVQGVLVDDMDLLEDVVEDDGTEETVEYDTEEEEWSKEDSQPSQKK